MAQNLWSLFSFLSKAYKSGLGGHSQSQILGFRGPVHTLDSVIMIQKRIVQPTGFYNSAFYIVTGGITCWNINKGSEMKYRMGFLS